MKIFSAAVILAVCLVASTGQAQIKSRPWTLALYLNHGQFEASGVDSDGRQTIGYFQAVRASDNWGVGFTGSYASTDYAPALIDGRFSLSTLTDTAIVSYYKTRWGRYNVRAGIDLGLPTGTSGLDTNKLSRLLYEDVGSDLLLLNTYGAGFNIAPHAAISARSGKTTWGMGLRYLYAGSYDPSTEIGGDSYNPGDALSILGSAIHSFSRRDSFMATLIFTTFGRDTSGGRDIYRNGDTISFEGRYLRRWSPGLTVSLVGAFRTQQRNERLSDNALITETGNSNGNQMELFTEAAYSLQRGLTLTGVAGYRTVAGNDYANTDLYYDGGRDKYYIEPGLIWRFSKTAYSTAKLRFTSLSDKQDAYSPDDATYTIYNLDLGVVYSF